MDNEYELLYLLKEEPDEILDILYKKYNSVLLSKIKKYNKWNINSDDYLNIARLSLYEAAENYHDNNKFITYLNTCLERSLINYKKSFYNRVWIMIWIMWNANNQFKNKDTSNW